MFHEGVVRKGGEDRYSLARLHAILCGCNFGVPLRALVVVLLLIEATEIWFTKSGDLLAKDTTGHFALGRLGMSTNQH